MRHLAKIFIRGYTPRLNSTLTDVFGQAVELKVLEGRGASTVLLAHTPQGNKLGVVKVLNLFREWRSLRKNSANPHVDFFPCSERLAREHEILANLSPHGLAPRPLYLGVRLAVQEYCPGPLLADLLPKLGKEAFELGLSALSQMHNLGVHHGDASPHNIIITDYGPRLIDFEHSLSETRYGVMHRIAFDLLRYCHYSWELLHEPSEAFFASYLTGGALESSVEKAMGEVLDIVPINTRLRGLFL